MTTYRLPVPVAVRLGPGQDPYLTWAAHTGSLYLVNHLADTVRLAGVLHKGRSLAEAEAVVRQAGSGLAIRSILGTAYFSAQISKPTNSAFEALLGLADFVLAEPGMRPLHDATRPLRAGPLPRKLAAAAPRADPIPPPARCEQEVVVGVVDGLCWFANQAFCDEGQSRLDFFWDQAGDPATSSASAGVLRWVRPAGFGYGRELAGPALNEIARQLRDAQPSDERRAAAERAIYRAIGHLLPDDADWSHGTHVLDTLLSDLVASAPDKAGAGRPGLVYVQLPEAALRDTSARWAAAYVLDAIDYVVSRARDDAKVVINLSLGSFAGPHDGSSLLERAIDGIVDRLEGRLTVVVAAGNAGRVRDDGTGTVKPCHARVTLEAAGGPASSEEARAVSLYWNIDAPDTTESFMEIWVPGVGSEGTPGAVSVSLSHERVASMRSGVVAPSCAVPIKPRDRVVGMVVNATGGLPVPNGCGGMVLVALGHTSDHAMSPAAVGKWEVRVTNESPLPLTIDVWVERRDIPGELLGIRPQYGVEDDGQGFVGQGALGTLANGRRTIVVGALDQIKPADTYTVSGYSSEGLAARVEDCNARSAVRRGPDVYCAGERNAAGYLTGARKTLAGSSMAAAQVSAAVASLTGEIANSRETMLDALERLAAQRQQVARANDARLSTAGSPARAPRLIARGQPRAHFVLPPVHIWTT